MGKTNDQELVLTRVFNAPRELVWEVWTKQEHIQQWWGPKGFTNPVCEWNASPKQPLMVHMQAPDGEIFPMGGEFIELVKPERFVFVTSALDSEGKTIFKEHNTIVLKEMGNQTKFAITASVTNITDHAAVPDLVSMNFGWNSSIDKLQDYLKQL